MNMKLQKFLRPLGYWMGVAVIGTAVGATLQFASAAWQEPGQIAPNGNVGAPLTTGWQGQAKYGGGIVLNATDPGTGLSAVNGLLVPNGNVGIGTVAPAAKLDILGANAPGSQQKAPDVLNVLGGIGGTSGAVGTGGAGGDIKLTGGRGGGGSTPGKGGEVILKGGTGGRQGGMGERGGNVVISGGDFGTGDVNGMGDVILAPTGGKVGIGTASPSFSPNTKLDVSGGSVNWNENFPGLAAGSLHLNPQNGTDHFGSAITFGASDYNGSFAQAGIYTRSDSTYGTKMYFATTDAYVTGPKTGMVIDHLSNVGIGTVNPRGKLDVEGEIWYNIRVAGSTYKETLAKTVYPAYGGEPFVGIVRSVSENAIRQYCGDIDGCLMTISMWNYDWFNRPYQTASREERFFYNASSTLGWWRFANNDLEGRNNDGIVHEWGVWDCYFTDAETSIGINNGRADSNRDFGLLNVRGGSYSDTSTDCYLTMRD